VKIYVVGNCQSISLAACLAVMLPGIEVERLEIAADPGVRATEDDLVFRQRNPRIAWTRRAARINEILFPRVFFNAFHPDLVFVAGPEGRVAAPLRLCHSSLVLYAWQRGLSVSRTKALFCEPVFEKLDFFRYWDAAKTVLLEEGEAIGFPLGALFEGWQRSGAFMHLSTHPALTVMADIARTLTARAGLSPAVDTPEYYLNDPLLALPVWPIYPEIASRLGCRGGYAFKQDQPPGWVATPDVLDLAEFIGRSFEAYAHMAPAALACTRLNHPAYRNLEHVAGFAKPIGVPAVGAAGRSDEAERARDLALEHRDELDANEAKTDGCSMDALDRSSMRAPLRIALPSAMTARSFTTIPCVVKNDGNVALATGDPHPVFLSYRWYAADGDLVEVGNSMHTRLREPLEPGGSIELAMELTTPRHAGRYRLAVALLQSNVAWFDDVAPENSASADVEVSEVPLRSGTYGDG
jgi:hypothetical protein